MTDGLEDGWEKTPWSSWSLSCDFKRRNLWFGCCSIDMEKVEQRLTARRGRTSGRNHMTINLVSLEGEDEVRAGDETVRGWVKPGEAFERNTRNLCLI